MAVIPYRNGATIPRAQQVAHDLAAYAQATKAMCCALGDYWMRYFKDMEVLSQTGAALDMSLAGEFSRVLDIVLSSSVLDIPTGDFRDFYLFSVAESSLCPVYDGDGKILWYTATVPNLKEAAFLTTTLFESPVILENGVHYEIPASGEVRFFVDLFHDPAIVDQALTFDAKDREILLWATDCALSSSLIYQRFGRYLYRKADDSEAYRWIVQALMRFYTGPKTNANLSDILNILYGVPYTRWEGETILDIYPVDANLERLPNEDEAPYLCVETDRASYYTYAFAELCVKVGDTVPGLTLLSNLCHVEDYISKPGWWETVAFPKALINDDLPQDEQNDLMDKILKYNTLFIRIDASFETWSSYLRQASTLFNIIQGGVPVYLFPVVLSVFIAAFTDAFNLDDSEVESILYASTESVYDADLRRYNGRYRYWPYPDRTHGMGTTQVIPLYDGVWAYSGESEEHPDTRLDKHGRMPVDGPHYDAAWTYHFEKGLDHDANKDRAWFGTRVRVEDSYDGADDELDVQVIQVG